MAEPKPVRVLIRETQKIAVSDAFRDRWEAFRAAMAAAALPFTGRESFLIDTSLMYEMIGAKEELARAISLATPPDIGDRGANLEARTSFWLTGKGPAVEVRWSYEELPETAEAASA